MGNLKNYNIYLESMEWHMFDILLDVLDASILINEFQTLPTGLIDGLSCFATIWES